MNRDVYLGCLKLYGKQHKETLREANNLAQLLCALLRFEEARTLMRKTIPVAQSVLNEGNDLMLMMRWAYGRALYRDDAATLDDLREAVTMLEETERIARRVFGGAHPLVAWIERDFQKARAALRARE